MQRIFIKNYFLFTVGSVCRVELVHNCVCKFSQRRSKVAKDARPSAEVVEIKSQKTFSSAGFYAVAKRWDKYNNVGGGSFILVSGHWD
jgi:hypothetical protein